MLIRPEREWYRAEVIYKRHGVAILHQVDRADEELACVATFHANVRELRRDVNRQLPFLVFATGRAKNPPKFPFVQAKRTLQEPFGAISLRTQHSKQWRRIAKWTSAARGFGGDLGCLSCEEFRVRLQKRPNYQFDDERLWISFRS